MCVGGGHCALVCLGDRNCVCALMCMGDRVCSCALVFVGDRECGFVCFRVCERQRVCIYLDVYIESQRVRK